MWSYLVHSWFRAASKSALDGRPARGPSRRPKRSYRPALEVLENRTALSPTTITLTASVNPARPGQPITFTATVTGGDLTPPATLSDSDNVKFLEGTTTLATVDPDHGFQNGRAQFTTVLAPGNHSITAVYSGGTKSVPNGDDISFTVLTNDPSTSNVVNEVVTAPVVPPRPIVAALVTRKVGATHRLFVRVSFADTGALKVLVRSPFQKPDFRAIAVAAIDGDGDGMADRVRLTARKGKKTVSRLLALCPLPPSPRGGKGGRRRLENGPDC
jgi:hypothetical protein